MTNTPEQLRYFLYARKSSESEDRQMASIEDQTAEVNKIAQELGLKIVGVFSESKSAKKPGRKAFNEMLLKIEQGEADGILCWKLNRLARNPIDGGKISWLLQQNIIKHIQCYGRDYKPTDNVLMMQVELGMANQFIKDLSVDIRRGVENKAKRGWNPSPTLPVGYIHNKDRKGKVHPIEIIPDPERYPIVKKLWELMLTGSYSIAEIKREGDKMGLVSERKKPYVISTYHQMFSCEFYFGYFYWRNIKQVRIRYKGHHQTAISEEEFDKVQCFLGNNRRATRAKQYDYAYRGWLRCGECHSSITAERKFQVRCTQCRHKFSCLNKDDCPKCDTKIKDMKDPTVIDITYYRCTKRKRKCSQKFITEQDLENQYKEVLQSVEIPEDFYNFLCSELKKLNENENTEELKIIQQFKKRKNELENRIQSLALMRADMEISKEEYSRIKEETKQSIQEIDKEIRLSKYEKDNWYKIAKEYLNLSLLAVKILEKKDIKQKKNFLSKLGSNQLIFDQKLCFIRAKPLLAIQDCFNVYNREKTKFEPEKSVAKQGLKVDFDTRNPNWCMTLYDVRTSAYSNNTLAA